MNRLTSSTDLSSTLHSIPTQSGPPSTVHQENNNLPNQPAPLHPIMITVYTDRSSSSSTNTASVGIPVYVTPSDTSNTGTTSSSQPTTTGRPRPITFSASTRIPGTLLNTVTDNRGGRHILGSSAASVRDSSQASPSISEVSWANLSSRITPLLVPVAFGAVLGIALSERLKIIRKVNLLRKINSLRVLNNIVPASIVSSLFSTRSNLISLEDSSISIISKNIVRDIAGTLLLLNNRSQVGSLAGAGVGIYVGWIPPSSGSFLEKICEIAGRGILTGGAVGAVLGLFQRENETLGSSMIVRAQAGAVMGSAAALTASLVRYIFQSTNPSSEEENSWMNTLEKVVLLYFSSLHYRQLNWELARLNRMARENNRSPATPFMIQEKPVELFINSVVILMPFIRKVFRQHSPSTQSAHAFKRDFLITALFLAMGQKYSLPFLQRWREDFKVRNLQGLSQIS